MKQKESEKLQALESILEQMLHKDIDITARAIVRESDDVFKNASDITRQPSRKAIFVQYRIRQRELRMLVEKTDKESKTNLQVRLARLTQENEELKKAQHLLIASHKAMLLAVGEMGGMAAWLKFFPAWEDTRKRMMELNAMPDNVIAL
ncbi:MAG: hypothetical protein C0508_29490 [Cyanobacteria bacterium PR.023]|nr:hypothetical protein [Cyanobacteria bacterium PR.023]